MTHKAGGAFRRAAVVLAAVSFTTACTRTRVTTAAPRWSSELAALKLFGDTGVTDTIANGALHRAFLVRQGPWAVHVLDIDRAACWTPVAVKGATSAVGRNKTSALTASLARPGTAVAGGVNADFFLFDPPGVPTGAHISGESVVTGPVLRPVFATDPEGRAWIGVLGVIGTAVTGTDSIPVTSWNRLQRAAVAWMDARYGASVDTLRGSVRIVLPTSKGTVASVDTGTTPTRIPSSGGVLVLGPNASTSVREAFLRAARPGAQVDVEVRLYPMHPQEAVGGFPALVDDSLETPGLDSAGAANFAPVRHPRTIVGVASGGRRLLLITIDGRQPGYSVGTTNRESARIALELGATEAINLDGGGSTAMAVAHQRGDSVVFELVNKPSDPQGERPVGNALVIARSAAGCGIR